MCQPGRINWSKTALWALMGTTIVLAAVAATIFDGAEPDPLVVIYPGSDGPSAEVFRMDFPDLEFTSTVGHDGQQVYAIARNPWSLEEASPHLDRPTYRLGRPLLSWLGWGLHPFGGGTGLAWALIAAGAAGVLVFGLAGGALMQLVGAPPQTAALFPVLPGTMATLSITTSDVLATGLLLACLAATTRRRTVLAGVLGALALLAKEPVALALAVFLLVRALPRTSMWGRRWRTAAGHLLRSPEVRTGLIAFTPWILWSVWIRLQLGPETRLVEFGIPFNGVVDGWREVWSSGDQLAAMSILAVTYLGAGWALAQGWRWPHLRALWFALLAQLVFTTTLTASVVALDYNGPRTTLPLQVLAIVVGTGAAIAARSGVGETSLVNPPGPRPASGP